MPKDDQGPSLPSLEHSCQFDFANRLGCVPVLARSKAYCSHRSRRLILYRNVVRLEPSECAQKSDLRKGI